MRKKHLMADKGETYFAKYFLFKVGGSNPTKKVEGLLVNSQNASLEVKSKPKNNLI